MVLVYIWLENDFKSECKSVGDRLCRTAGNAFQGPLRRDRILVCGSRSSAAIGVAATIECFVFKSRLYNRNLKLPRFEKDI